MSETLSSAGSGWWRPEPLGAGAIAPPAGAEESRVPFWSLLAFTLVLIIAPQTMVPGLASLRPALLAAAVALVAHVGHRLFTGRPITVVTRELWLAGGLLAWAALTVPLSYWPGGSVSFMLSVYLKSLLVFWLLANVLNTPARLRQVVVVLSLTGAPLGITAIHNYLSGAFISGAVGVRRIAGYDAPLTQNPNDLALMLNLLLPLAIGLLLSRPHPFLRAALVATVALDVAGVVVTFSRAGFLALGATLAAWLWKLRQRRERGWAFLALIGALVCLPLLPGGYTERLATVTNTNADTTGSAQARWRDTVAAVRFVTEHPLVGAGIGQDVLALNEERGARWRAVHNVYLQYAVELGLPGLALFALLLGSCLASAGAAERASAGIDPGGLSLLAAGVRISLIAFMVAALFHPASYHFYFYYIAGLAIALKLMAETLRVHPAPAESGLA